MRLCRLRASTTIGRPIELSGGTSAFETGRNALASCYFGNPEKYGTRSSECAKLGGRNRTCEARPWRIKPLGTSCASPSKFRKDSLKRSRISSSPVASTAARQLIEIGLEAHSPGSGPHSSTPAHERRRVSHGGVHPESQPRLLRVVLVEALQDNSKRPPIPATPDRAGNLIPGAGSVKAAESARRAASARLPACDKRGFAHD